MSYRIRTRYPSCLLSDQSMMVLYRLVITTGMNSLHERFSCILMLLCFTLTFLSFDVFVGGLLALQGAPLKDNGRLRR